MRLRLHKWPKLLSSLPVTKTGIHHLLWHWLFHINSAHVSSPLLCIVKRLKSTRTVHASSTRCLESSTYTIHKHNTNFSLSWKASGAVTGLAYYDVSCSRAYFILLLQTCCSSRIQHYPSVISDLHCQLHTLLLRGSTKYWPDYILC